VLYADDVETEHVEVALHHQRGLLAAHRALGQMEMVEETAFPEDRCVG